MKCFALSVSAVLFFLTLSFQAWAGEGLFSRAYTTETVPEGHYELEQTIRNRTHRAYGQYSAYDFKSEFEYGVTDNFQMAFYINTGYVFAANAPDDNDPGVVAGTATGINQNVSFLQSVAAEFVYRVLSPVSDPIGLAFYFEPEIDFTDLHNGDRLYDSMENEFRVLFQKNYMNDQLILVYNLIFETEYFRYSNFDSPWQGEFDWNNELGASYRFASNWYGGIEARNHNEIGNFWHHDHSVYWLGPVLHYGGTKLWVTLGFLGQVYGSPSGTDSTGSNQGPSGYFLHSHEMLETTLKVGLAY